jgi:hypothetical protein
MRCVVWTGSRGWRDVITVEDAIDSLRQPFRSIVGGAEGFDTIVEDALRRRGLPYLRYDADWERHGRGAGPTRNGVMLKVGMLIDSDAIVVSGWDGKSRGTMNCRNQARKMGMPIVDLVYHQKLNRQGRNRGTDE